MAVYLSHDALRKWADPRTYQEAMQVYRLGAVRHLRIEGNNIYAEVGNHDSPVFTRFTILEDGSVASDCPCYQHQQYHTVCCHVVAAGFAVADLTEDPIRERAKRIAMRISHAQQIATSPIPLREPLTTPSAVPAHLRIRIDEEDLPPFAKSSIQISVQICVEGKNHNPTRIDPNRKLAFSDHDIHLLYVLEDMADQVRCPASLTLTPRLFSQLLSEMAGGKIWIRGEQTPLSLAEEAAIGALQISLEQKSGELRILYQSEPAGKLCMASQYSGWILSGATLYPMETVLPHDLWQAAQGGQRIPRTQLFDFLGKRVVELQDSFIIEQNFDSNLFRFIRGQPSFEVHMMGDADQATVSLWCVYESARFLVRSSDTMVANERIPVAEDTLCYYRRSVEEEQNARSLFAAHFEEEDTSTDNVILKGATRIIHVMADVAPALERLGWTVCFGNRVADLSENACWVRPCITIDEPAETTASSYRLRLTYRDENGHDVNSDYIETALRSNQAVVSGVSQTCLINVPALNALTSALEECLDYREGEAFVSRIHAGFILALTHAFGEMQLSVPDSWRQHASEQQSKTNLEQAPVQAELYRRLRPYQREGVNWLCFLDRSGYCGILADEMGLGKTVQALAWLQCRCQQSEATGHRLPSMVVCPTSLLHNWAREAERFTPSLKCCVLSGHQRRKQRETLDCYDIVITSYALLRRDIAHYDHTLFSAIILDEAQHIKNRSTQNAVAAKRLKGLRRLVLTGTPMENSVNDLWSIMDFLMPGYLGTHASFKVRFEQPITQGKANSQRAVERLKMKLEPFMLRRLKTDVAKDLPEKVTRIADCPMLPSQQRLYRRLQAQYYDRLSALVEEQGFEESRFSIFSALLRLRQCCCHPALLKGIQGSEDIPSGKMDLFFELLDEAIDGGHRVLVFSQFVQMLHILRQSLQKRGLAFAYLDGSTRDRMQQVDFFNNSHDVPVFLVSLKAGGSGLNLTGADVVIHYDPWWNPAVEDQATDRAHRIGQSRTVYSIKLVTENSIEQKVIDLQQRKRKIIQSTIGSLDSLASSLDWQDIQDLLLPPSD